MVYDAISPVPFKPGQMNKLHKLWTPAWAEILANSLDCDGDEYDRLGRNVSAQERRQELFPWFTVVRSHAADHWQDDKVDARGVQLCKYSFNF